MNQELMIQQIKEIVRKGICISCGACVFLDQSGKSKMIQSEKGPLPFISSRATFAVDPLLYCPAKRIDYWGLYKSLQGGLPDNHLIGNYISLNTGFSNDDGIRANSSSGGILSHSLTYLLEQGLVDYVICAMQGLGNAGHAAAVITKEPCQIRECAQSIYQPVAMLEALAQIDISKRYAITLLPEQCAILRQMQIDGIPQAGAIKYVLGTYTGTQIYPAALKYFYKRLHIKEQSDIEYIKWRAGAWPGYLEIKSKRGQVIRSRKIYYNFLIPFYISHGSLVSIDFANEFTDLSVGDAWNPSFEEQGGGHSVICIRSREMADVLEQMRASGNISLNEITWEEAGRMHGHMLDFKKRGSFIRIKYMQILGRPVPRYSLKPRQIGFSRYLVEAVNFSLFMLAGHPFMRAILNYIPEPVLGAIFNFLRLRWKSISKPTKRKGLAEYQLEVQDAG